MANATILPGETFKHAASGTIIQVVKLTAKRVVTRSLTSSRSDDYCVPSQIEARGYQPYKLTGVERLCLRHKGDLTFLASRA